MIDFAIAHGLAGINDKMRLIQLARYVKLADRNPALREAARCVFMLGALMIIIGLMDQNWGWISRALA